MGFFASSGILNQRGFFSAPVSAAPPAPSGIPVAGADNILITTNTFSYIFEKNLDQQRYQYLEGCDDEGCAIRIFLLIYNRFNQGTPWSLYDSNEDVIISENPSVNPDFIPTSGWSPSITITAA